MPRFPVCFRTEDLHDLKARWMAKDLRIVDVASGAEVDLQPRLVGKGVALGKVELRFVTIDVVSEGEIGARRQRDELVRLNLLRLDPCHLKPNFRTLTSVQSGNPRNMARFVCIVKIVVQNRGLLGGYTGLGP
jgi:hypothetical protein